MELYLSLLIFLCWFLLNWSLSAKLFDFFIISLALSTKSLQFDDALSVLVKFEL